MCLQSRNTSRREYVWHAKDPWDEVLLGIEVKDIGTFVLLFVVVAIDCCWCYCCLFWSILSCYDVSKGGCCLRLELIDDESFLVIRDYCCYYCCMVVLVYRLMSLTLFAVWLGSVVSVVIWALLG